MGIDCFFAWLLGLALGGLGILGFRDERKKPVKSGLPDQTELKILELQKHYKFTDRNTVLTAAIDLLDRHKKTEAMYTRDKEGTFHIVEIKA